MEIMNGEGQSSVTLNWFDIVSKKERKKKKAKFL